MLGLVIVNHWVQFCSDTIEHFEASNGEIDDSHDEARHI